MLCLDGGTVIKLTGSTNPNSSDHPSLIVDGALLVENAAANPVVFTHLSDDAWGGDTEGNGNTTPSRGHWGGLVLRGASTDLERALIRYAGGTRYINGLGYISGGVYITGNNAAIRTSTFTQYYGKRPVNPIFTSATDFGNMPP